MAERFIIDGLTSLREPTSVSFKKKHITNEERTMSGKLVVDYIATKSTISVSWGVLDDEEFTALKNHIDGKRKENGFYTLTFGDSISAPAPQMTAYTEELSFYPYFLADGSVVWRDVSIEFVEV